MSESFQKSLDRHTGFAVICRNESDDIAFIGRDGSLSYDRPTNYGRDVAEYIAGRYGGEVARKNYAAALLRTSKRGS